MGFTVFLGQAEPVLPNRLDVQRSRQECNSVPIGEPRSNQASNGSGAVDQELHFVRGGYEI